MVALALLSTYTLATAQEEPKIPHTPELMLAALPIAPQEAKMLRTQDENEVENKELERRVEVLKSNKELKVENIKEQLQEKKEEVKQTTEERKQQWTEKRNTTIQNYSKRMHLRLETALTRMEQIKSRIQTRVEKLTHMDTEEALVHLDMATENIEQLQTRLQESKGSITDTLTSEDPKANFEQSREQIREIADELKGIHATMTKAVVSLRAQVEEVVEEVVDEEVAEEVEE